MSKDPAFLFYDGDAARDVSHMNRLERGCYFDLIQAQRKFHGITIEQARKILGKDFESCWSALELVLSKDKELYFIEWVRESIEQRKKHAEQQRKRIQDYWDKKKGESDIPRNNDGKSVDLPLVNEDENENENIIEDIKESKEEKLNKREIQFKSEVYEFNNYPTEMLDKFCTYWTEPNKSKTKMRFELQEVFDIKRRLVTWATRDNTFNHEIKRVDGYKFE